MKKTALALSLTICSASLVLISCSEVGNTTENSSVSMTESFSVTTTEEITDYEVPTERVKDIQSSDSFDYEIIDGFITITGYTGSDEAVIIPSDIDGTPVNKIGNHAFEGKYKITSVELPDTIILIGESAFSDCESLTEINIPSSVTGIDRAAFASCVSLGDITVPSSVQYIKEEAFTACEAMTTLTIENPDMIYENWGLEDLPELEIDAPSGSAVEAWAEAMGK